MKRIGLTRGKSTIVDDDTYETLGALKWHSVVNHSGNWYATRAVRCEEKQRQTFLHHCVVGFPLKGNCVDHINGDSLDNRRENLRVVSFRQNCCNTKGHRNGRFSSKFPGVTLHQGFWKCQVCVGGFKTEVEAAEFRNKLVTLVDTLKGSKNGTI